MTMAFDLEREVRDLAARRDITQALQNYMRGQDRLDHGLQMTSFHDGADVDCGLLRGGPQAYTDFAQGFLADLKSSQHLIGQVDLSVDIDAGTGTGEVYFFAWHRIEEDGEPKDLMMAGRYVDEYRCIDDKWAIWKRRELIDWARTDPAADGVLQAMPLIHLAGRKGADFSQTRDWSAPTSGR
jgi:hypothetical protein